jgi:DNA-directed RNA polymerase specialized sigma24 family protein
MMIERLKQEDPRAAGEIWQRFFAKLLPLARARLRGLADRAVNEEDLLVSVFDRFFRAAEEKRFARLDDRDDLWQILLMLTDHKVSEQFRHSHAKKRGGGKVVALDNLANGNDAVSAMVDSDPTPEFIATFNDQLARGIARLRDDSTREVALLKLEGYENREIATRLDIGLSSVERKLRVIREVWATEFGNSP